MRAKELNFMLRLGIIVHFDRQLRASHLILGCVPSYTSYEDSLSALTIGSPLLSYLDIQATQLTHVVKGRLKDVQEEADKEKALKQVAKASLQEKTMGLIVMERWATTAENALELVEQKASELLSKLEEAELKLMKTACILSAWEKEFPDLKGGDIARK
nr:hypothetical protein CFP56_68864 [Quercus suber]